MSARLAWATCEKPAGQSWSETPQRLAREVLGHGEPSCTYYVTPAGEPNAWNLYREIAGRWEIGVPA